MTLNPDQAAAVASTAAVTVVLAGPGAGKTRTLIERINALIATGVDPATIIVLTLTNAAAHVLVERLGIELGYVGTGHGFCMKLIQRFGNLLGYRAGSVSVVTEDVKEELLQECAATLGRKLPAKRNRQWDAPWLKQVLAEYRHRTKRWNMVDHDQCLEQALAILVGHSPELRYRYLLVDEAQDNAPVEWCIYLALNLPAFYVGDIDQSVFVFRGAAPEMLLEASSRKATAVFTLPLNYRSDVLICQAATKLISHNKQRIDKPVIPVTTEHGIMVEKHFSNGYIEAHFAASVASEHPTSTAVLCRTNGLVQIFRKAMLGLEYPVANDNADVPEDWSFALSCISVLLDPQNDFHARTVLKRIRPHEFRMRERNAIRDGLPLWSSVLSLPPPTIGQALNELVSMGVSAESMELIHQRIALLTNPTLSELLTDLWNHDKWTPRASEGVVVTTIHKAKGREWDVVIVPALEEGMFPLRCRDGYDREAHMEEERRLCFVAITRARHKLILSHSQQRTMYGKTTTQEPSRFIGEML